MGEGQQAGYRAGRTVTTRNCLLSPLMALFAHGMIDSANAYDGKNTGYEKELRPGTPMGRITATKLWVPCRRTTTTSNGAVTAQLQLAWYNSGGTLLSTSSGTATTLATNWLEWRLTATAPANAASVRIASSSRSWT